MVYNYKSIKINGELAIAFQFPSFVIFIDLMTSIFKNNFFLHFLFTTTLSYQSELITMRIFKEGEESILYGKHEEHTLTLVKSDFFHIGVFSSFPFCVATVTMRRSGAQRSGHP